MDERINDRAWLDHAYSIERRSTDDIARELGCATGTVKNRLHKLGIPVRSRGEHFKGQAKPPEQREKMAASRKAYWDANPATEEFKDKIAAARTRSGSRMGRPYLRIPGRGYVAEHIYVAEQKIGRRLDPGEHVHHIDGDIANNHPDNLTVLTAATHAALHGLTRQRDEKGRFK